MKTIQLSNYGVVISPKEVHDIGIAVREGVQAGEAVTLDFKGVKGIYSDAAHDLLKSMRGHKGAIVQMKNAAPMVKSVMMYSSGATIAGGTSAPSKKHSFRLLLLLLLLTLGVGQMWGASYPLTVNYPYVYLDNSSLNWSGCNVIVGHDSYSYGYLMSSVTGTKLFYKEIEQNWGDAKGIVFISATSEWGEYKNQSLWDRTNSQTRTGYKWDNEYEGLNYHDTYLCTSTGSSDLNIDYKSDGFSALNSTQTIQSVVKTGDGSYTSANSKATISISSYELTSHGTTTNRTPELSTSESSETVSAARTATTTLTVGDVASGYQFDGWYTEATGGTQLSSSTTYTYYPTAATTVYARFSEKMSAVTLSASPSGKGTFTIGGAAATSTSVGVTTTKSVTAVPASGYHFVSWAVSGGATISNTTDNPVTVTGTGAGTAATLTATFAANDVYTLTTAAGTGISSVTGTTNNISAGQNIDITATVATGYTWSTWTKTGSGTLSTFTAGTKDQTVIVGTAGDITLTASATENKSTITVTTATSSQGTLKFGSTSKSWEATASVGVATTQEITATAAAGFTFVRWDLSGAAASESSLTNATITLKADGSGSTGTATAVFAEDLTTTWYINGDAGGTSPFEGWGTSGTPMLKKTGHSTEEIYYCTIHVGTTATGDGFGFKAYNSAGADDAHRYYAYSDREFTKAQNSCTLYTNNNANNMKFKPYLTGDYEFKLDNTGANPMLTVTWPVYNQVRISAADPTDATNTGNFDLSDPVSNVRTVTRSLEANTTYTFKVVYNSEWYGKNSGAFTRSTSTSSNTETISTSGGDITLTTDYAGDYTFRFNQSDKTLSVDFPEAYKITYGKGSVNGSTGSCSAVNTDNGNSSVTSNSTWVKSGHHVKLTAPDEKEGYSWDGWYDNTAGTGDKVYTTNVCTLTVSSAANLYACYTINNHAITYTAPSHGSYTITVGTADAVSANTTSDYGKTITLAANPAPGYHFGSWNVYKTGEPATTVTVTNNQFAMPDYPVTVSATFAANTYSVTFDANGGTGDAMGPQAFTYDVAQALSANTYTRTGYDFDGWATTAEGAKVYDPGQSVSNLIASGTFPLFAHWTAKSYTVTLEIDEANHGTIDGKATSASVTFDAAPTAIAADQLPTAAQGYAFMGFYSEAGGNGRRFIDQSGNWVTAAGDTISGGNWVKPAGITLYAYYKKAEITALTLDNAVVAPSETVGVTPRVAPTPTGTNSICWKLLYSNGNLYSPQPTFSPASPAGISNKVTFTAPPTSGMYLIAAVLRTGNDCSGGTRLDSVTSAFQVAGDHTVTVQYKDAEGNTLQASGTVNGRPLVWSDDITAPDIFGYTFARWDAGDGVTIKNGDSDPVTTSTDVTIKIKAVYDGRLTAVYTQKQMIYFKNTLGWSSVYVNFLTGDYWNETNGSGNNGVTNRNKAMTQIDDTDIWYYDFGTDGINPTRYVSFTEDEQEDGGYGYENFYKADGGENVVYPARRADDLVDKAGAIGFYAATPMFVPLAGQTPVVKNSTSTGQANYYNSGYWTKYTSGTGYTLEVYYDSDSSEKIKDIAFNSADELMPLAAVANLEASRTYRFRIKRAGDVYYGNAGTMTYADHGQNVAWEMSKEATRRNDANTEDVFAKCKITTTAAGDYTFNLSYSGDNSNPVQYRLRMEVDYPIADGDYRLIYTDATRDSGTRYKPSAIVTKAANHKDTVSFFIRPESSPVMKIQQSSVNSSTGAITWNDISDISSEITDARCPKDSVYNICLTMNESGDIFVENVEGYTGSFYIRTDAANSKWDNYRAADHLMTYSEYSETYSDYTHYFMAYVGNGNNVKFVVANDYSPCISDTLVQSTFRDGDSYHVNASGDIQADANVRFMWNRSNNAVYRAYLDRAKSDGSRFLVLRANNSADLMDADGNALLQASTSEQAGYNHGAPDNSIQFVDNENWIYETNVKVKPGAYVKLYAHFHDKDFYYRGNKNDDFDGIIDGGSPNAIQLITGEGAAVKVRVVYDFKTDRLLAAWMPEGEIKDSKAINADVMFVREGQGDIAQLTFTESGEITDIKTAYGVMKFNKWTLNNKDKSTHTVLSSPASIYERSLFWISFPFRVKLSEVFGFGTYGVDWAIQRYDGAERAEKGFWAESSGFWKWMDRNTEYLEPDQGYLLAIDLDLLGESASVWDNGVENVELYFPSYGTMPSITSAAVEHTLPSHACEIDWSGRSNGNGGTLGSAYNRTIIDSHWNVLSVPTYVNTSNIDFANDDWIAESDGKHGPNFLYTWNASDNTLTPTAGEGYHYHAMHAYMVQYHGDVTWTASSGSPYSSIVARRTYAEQPKKVNFCLEIQQNEKMIDRTFVQLSDDEEVSAEFSFGEDMGKEFNSRKANIYTVIENYLPAAGNTLPMSDQTTLVPVGVKTTAAGEYTFAMPEGTNGVSVVLIDNIAGTRTNLALSDYTVALGKGDLSDRFMLEIAPIKQMPTDIENVQGGDVQGAKARKVMVDGILYIVKDGKVFDARGAKVK